ncbi:MAG: hypothetical protein J0I09_14920 [Sphingobacteriia bacterium]|nr:hypothetical protein [Sphingobacteriia bacterium]
MSVAKYPIYENENVYYTQQNSAAADRELDYFNFNFNGRSGTFVLGKNNGDKGILLGDANIKIWFERDPSLINQGIRTTISAFYIQDESGLIYKFKKLGLSKVLVPALLSHYSNTNYTKNIQYEVFYDFLQIADAPYTTNSWYLTEVQDVLTGRSVRFNYIDRNINNDYGFNIKTYVSSAIDRVPNLTTNTTIDFSGANISTGRLPFIISKQKCIQIQPTLNSITFPDGYNINCSYSSSERFDWKGDFPMEEILVRHTNRIVSKITLNTNYFVLNTIKKPITDVEKSASRLCLKSIQTTYTDMKEISKPMVFEYFMGTSNEDIVPPLFCNLKDIWGYYNADFTYKKANGNYYSRADWSNSPVIININDDINSLDAYQLGLLCFIGENSNIPISRAKPEYAKNGILKSIYYPDGHSLEYQYSQNRAWLPILSNSNNDMNVGGVSVSDIFEKAIDGSIKKHLSYNYVLAPDSANPYPTIISSRFGVETPINKTFSTNVYVQEDKSNIFFGLGGCRFKFKYPGLLQRQTKANTVSNNLYEFNLIFNIGKSYLKDIVKEEIFKVMKMQGYLTSSLNNASILGAIIQYVRSIIASCDDSWHFVYTDIYTNTNLTDANPLPNLYSRVEVIEVGATNKGKTIYDFSSFSDKYNYLTINMPFVSKYYGSFASKKQRFMPWAYGLPKKITTYDASGNVLSQHENVYDFQTYANRNINDGTSSSLSCECYVKQNRSQNGDDWNNPVVYDAASNYTITGNDDIDVNFYNYYTGRVELKDSYDRTYKPNSSIDYLETGVHYDYNPVNFQPSKITTTLSNGDKIIKEIYYVSDYNNTGVFAVMKNNNMLSVPVASYTSIKKNGTITPLSTGASITEYGVIGNGDIRPIRSLTGRVTIPSFTYQFDPSNLFNYPNLKDVQLFTYDNTGNLISTQDEGKHDIANVYDYDDRFVVASVINANMLVDKPAYTSFETPNNFGGWVASGTVTAANYIANTSVTGNNGFNLDANVHLSASGFNLSKSYKLSFWANNGNVQVTNAQLVKSSPSVNGFTYYEYSIPANTNATEVSVASGNTIIDELRVYPENSRMRTVTYDMFYGKTSECDENNRIIYYEYDSMGRLRFIRNEKKEILKMMEYNLKN